MTKVIDGRTILAEKDAPRFGPNCAIVLAEVGGFEPYVTWVYNRTIKDSFSWGHYHRTLAEATAEFEQRT